MIWTPIILPHFKEPYYASLHYIYFLADFQKILSISRLSHICMRYAEKYLDDILTERNMIYFHLALLLWSDCRECSETFIVLKKRKKKNKQNVTCIIQCTSLSNFSFRREAFYKKRITGIFFLLLLTSIIYFNNTILVFSLKASKIILKIEDS